MNKPVLIFLHGGPGFEDYLSPYFEELNSSFTTIFYNQLRGPDIKIDDLLSQLHQIVTSHQGKKILVGHSWGGVLAAEYAIRKQEELSGLVLMSTGLTHIHWYEEFRKEKVRLGLTESMPSEIFLTEEERKDGSLFLDKTWETFSGETFDSLEESYLRTFDLTEAFKTLKIPILNIYGEHDVRFPAKVARNLKKFNDQMVEVEIPGAGHFPFLKESGRKKIIQAISNFF